MQSVVLRADIQGMMVQKMMPPGRETILGMSRDPHFGPLLMIGLGGTLVEVFRDVNFQLAPISEDWALKNDPGAQGLPGPLRALRGEPAADLAAIVESLERLSQLVLDFSEFKELDINPFVVFDYDSRLRPILAATASPLTPRASTGPTTDGGTVMKVLTGGGTPLRSPQVKTTPRHRR